MSDDAAPKRVIGEITTNWRQVHDPLKFFMTYGPAVRNYLLGILRDEHEADEALQDLLVQVTERGFGTADPERGRFRDYLKAVVRHIASRRSRRSATRPRVDADLECVPAADNGAERAWTDEWRGCVLDNAWRALERHERAAKTNLAYTVLRLAADHPDEDSQQLAARAAARSGRTISPEAFRKQLSRARRLFASLVVDVVRATLDDPSEGSVARELADLGLLEHVRHYCLE